MKFNYQEQKEFAEIEDVIAELEAKIKQLSAKIDGAATDFVLLFTKKETLARQLRRSWTGGFT